MSTAMLNGFADRLRRGLPTDPRADGELVREFAATASEAAFAELVHRFTPLVWGVCRRAVPDRQLAEDAFQATFLVLVRKAGSVRPNAVGGWLQAVAVHTSNRARAMADRRKTRVRPLGDHDPAATATEPADPDTLRALDEEISRLPESLRVAVVLCELEGQSRAAAATRLGIAEGTLSSRLAAARKRLAARLRDRGVTVTAAFALVAQTADAGSLREATPPAPPMWTPAPSDIAVSLADGVIRTMFLSKLKLTAGVLAALVAVLTAGTLSAAPPDSPQQRYQIKAPIPKEKDKEGVIAVGLQEDQKNRIDLLTPKGEKVATIPLDPHPMYHLALSRDGKRVAVWAWDQFPTDGRLPPGQKKVSHTGTLLVYDVGTPDKPLLKLEGVLGGGCVFAPDGKTVFLNELAEPDEKKVGRDNTVYKLDLTTQKKEKLTLPADHHVIDLSPDGKTLLTVSHAEKVKGEYGVATHLVPLDTLKPKLVTEANIGCNRFSPDGTRLLGQKYTGGGITLKQELVTVDVKTGKDTPVKLEDDTYMIWNTAWSADGTKVLVKRDVLMPGAKPPMPVGNPGGGVFTVPDNRPELAVRNLDGTDPKPLLELKKGVHVFGIDWR